MVILFIGTLTTRSNKLIIIERGMSMRANCNIEIDGKVYTPGEEYPDLGSLICVNNTHEVREYEGLTQDVSKLPTGKMEKYRDLKTGSSFMATDSDLYKKYDSATCMWYEK